MMPRGGAEVRIEGLRKRFGRQEVLKGIDATIAPGRVTALVGPNAAGKSTLIKTIVGLVKVARDGGRILFDGVPIGDDSSYRERIGYMPQSARFPEQLTGREIIDLVTSLRPAKRTDTELIDRFELEAIANQPIRTLSGGTRQKLNAALAFLFEPALVVLDEPTAGLDPIAAGTFKEKVARAPAEGTTVLLTSHILAEVEELAQEIIFLLDGQVAFHGPIPSLLERAGATKLEQAVAALMERP
jgi:Cu-processing system ATP-binding protein